MTDTPNFIRDILRLVDDYAQGFDVGAPEPTIEDIESAINAYILGEVMKLIPEPTIGAPSNVYETGGECSAYADGYNQLRQELRNEANERWGK